MHLRRSWVAFGLVALCGAASLAQAGAVYKWTDADGVVHFSDQPVPGAEKIFTSTGASRGILGQPAPGAPAGEKPKARASALALTSVAITAPARDETFTGGQQVSVSLTVEPPLTANQTVAWTLNGSPLVNQAADATQFTIPDLPRGVYTLAATVQDSVSGDTKSAEPVTFNVVRPSLLSPARK